MISITLPSIFPEALRRAIANVASATRGPYELIVVADFERPGWAHDRRLVWITSPREGCAAAHSLAASKARGEFVTAFSDDFLYVPGWDKAMIDNFRRRERAGPFVLGVRYDWSNLVGTVFGIYYANFPFVRRTTLQEIGYISGPYKRGFGDSDFSLRAWAAGGRCEFSEGKFLKVTEDDNRKGGDVARPEDMALFLARWGKRFGAGWDTSHLRGFNLDVDPDNVKEHVEGNTIYCNDPRFARPARAEAPPYLIETVGTVNMVEFRGEVYAIPQHLGPVDLADEASLRAAVHGGARKFKTVAEAKERFR